MTHGLKRRSVAFGLLIPMILAITPMIAAATTDDGLPPTAMVRTDADGNASMILGVPYLTGASDAAAADIALDFVSRHRALFGLSARQVDDLVVLRDFATAAIGSHHVTLGQEVGGVPVATTGLTFAIDADGRITSVGGPLARGQARGSRQLDAADAIDAAGRAAGIDIPELPRQRSEGAEQRFTNTFADVQQPNPVLAETLWYPHESGDMRLAWKVDFEVDGEHWLVTYVDAETGKTLDQYNRYAHAQPQGTVFTGQHPDDSGPRAVTPFSGIDGSWVTDRVTSGNNVNAYRDLDNSNTVGYRPQTPESGEAGYQHFQYAWTDAWQTNGDGTDASLDADLDAVITQLFYYTNHIHDWLYDYGFDEASGNFQVDNFGRGGSDGDPVLAEAQDGWDFGCSGGAARCRNNANFATPSDGNSPRMQMYMWDTSPPGSVWIDGSMDGDVVAHEYGHGVTHRLVGGSDGAFGYNTHLVHASLSEGWADVTSFLIWGDAVIGEYVTGDAATGIRRVAYDNSNHTYNTYNPNAGSGHPNGEVWASMVYDIRDALGIDATAWLVYTGMKSTPGQPDFLDARDGIFSADTLVNGGDNFCLLWGIFANRGLGTGATFDLSSNTSPANNFDVPDDCRPNADPGGPYVTPEGTPVTLDASGSTPGTHATAGPIVSYEWDLDNDGDFDDAVGVTTSFTNVGDDGVFTVGLRVTSSDGITDEATTTVTVTNVDPSVSIAAGQVTTIDEGDTVTVNATYSDPGWLDTHTATIDWGTPAGDVSNVVPIVTDPGNPGPVQGTVSGSFTYGDNGVFEITVTVTDDDGGEGSASFLLTVDNVDPTATIDLADAVLFNGVPTILAKIGEEVEVTGNATDPGSDDLTLTWDWDDGTPPTVTVYLNDPPNPDPFPSPEVNPRDVTDVQAHTWTEACLYELAFIAEDDDGGSDTATADVIIVGNADQRRSAGYWHNQYRPTGGGKDFTDAQLECYLDIVGHVSAVFHGVVDASTLELAAELLQGAGPATAADQLDRQLLAVWLNFANGSVGLDDPINTTGKKNDPTTPFHEVILWAEQIRLDPTSTTAELNHAKDVIERINTGKA